MAFWIFSWTTWIAWIVSAILITAIDWDSDIIASPELSNYGPLWTYFGSESENVSVFHSREYIRKRMGKFKDVDPERLFSTFVQQ